MTWRELLAPIREIYARHGAGCCWHVVLDDGNTGRAFIESTCWNALQARCEGCIAAGVLFLQASETQLRKARYFR